MTQQEFHERYQYNPNSDCLGEGGFGKVYKAYDTHRDRYVAIKMAEVRPHLEEVRLKKEVEIISELPSHPNIAYYEECYTFSTFAGEYDFGVLQYYEEGNLQQLLIEKQLSYEQKDSILRQILEGIVFLHNQGIIHRDLKPQNILIVNRLGEFIPKITDFGISKKLDVNKSSVFSNSLAGIGTLSFSSPEQLLGNKLGKNTDLWSFGVMTCWTFTGKLPFNTGNVAVTSEAGRIELFKQITSGDITSTIRLLPSAWRGLIKKCIVVDVDKRISSAMKCLELLNLKTGIDTEEKIEKEKYQTTKTKIPISPQSTIISTPQTVTDIDGNIYPIIRLGNIEWMLENLRTTRYSNGEIIGTTNSATKNLFFDLKPKYQWAYDGNESNVVKYGRLYTWFAATDPRGIAPTGWRIPHLYDWKEMKEYLINAGLVKILRGGSRGSNGSFFHIGYVGSWWSPDTSSLDKNYGSQYHIQGDFDFDGVGTQSSKKSGLSIRCIRNVY